MRRYTQTRIQGSLWGRGVGGILLGAAVLVVLLVFVPAIRLFAGISVAIGVVAAGILYLYNKYVPVREPEEARIVLHLNDEPPRAASAPPSDKPAPPR